MSRLLGPDGKQISPPVMLQALRTVYLKEIERDDTFRQMMKINELRQSCGVTAEPSTIKIRLPRGYRSSEQ